MSMAALRWARGVRGVTSTQKLVLLLLADTANDYGDAWPSALALAEDSGLSDRAVRNALDALERHGLIEGQRELGRATRWCVRVGSEPRSDPSEPPAAPTEPRSDPSEPDAPRNHVPTTPEPDDVGPRNVVQGGSEPRSDRTLINPQKNPQGTPIGDAAVAAPPRRGSRLPADWWPDDELAGYADQLGLDPRGVAENFRDYWHAKAGKDATKLDWAATWRGWCRRDAERRGGARGRGGSRDLQARLLDRFLDEREMGEPT